MRILALALAITGCSGTARGLEAYRTDTEHVLQTRSAQLQSCYDDVLKSDGKATGTVAVQFVVEKKTGTLGQATLDAKRTTAPPALGSCVLKAVEGLVLAPADRNDGRATFVYEFKPAPPTSS
jgi:hypothetical protein